MWIRDIKGVPYCQERVKDRAGRSHVISVRVKDGSKRARKEAQEELRQKVEAYDVTDRMCLSAVASIYNREQAATLRPSTCHRNSCTLRTIIGIVGDIDINDLTAGYIRERMLSTGKSAGTINQYIKRFKGFLRWAYQNDYLQRSDVYEKLTYLKDTPHKVKIADKYLEPEELRILLDSMDVPRWRCLTEFLALSGLRIGEAIALDNDDIDGDYIHVYKTVRINQEQEIGDAKTLSSVRDVYIQPELEQCLWNLKKVKREQREAVESAAFDSHPLFVGLNGQRIQYRAYSKYLKEKSRAALGREISPHALRHTHTSILAAQGVPFDTISRRLGHENSQITRDIYFHITRGLRLADASKIAKVKIVGEASGEVTRSEPLKIKHVQ